MGFVRSCWRSQRWFSLLLLSCALMLLMPSTASATGAPAPMPTQGGVPDVWRCQDQSDPEPTGTVTPDPEVLYDTGEPPQPTATVTPPPYPLPSPTATVTRCRVTSWATSAAPAPSSAVTVVEPTTPREVVLAPDQFAQVDAWGDAGVFAVGGLLMLAIAAAIWVYSRPATFGFTSRRRH